MEYNGLCKYYSKFNDSNQVNFMQTKFTEEFETRRLGNARLHIMLRPRLTTFSA